MWRELWGLRGQAFAIAMVIASGIATYVISASTLHSLQHTQQSFYRDYRFADVFVSLKRAPERIRERIERIPGVQSVASRVMAQVNLDIEGFSDPATGLLVSIPDQAAPMLNNLYLRSGALPDPGRDDQVVVSEPFAEAHAFTIGDQLGAIINGRRQQLTIVGTALSPEFIYQLRPGDMFPDFERYGIMWMRREALGTAYGMQGAFNNAVLTLSRVASAGEVIEHIDALLEYYGGQGAYERRDQFSHRYITQEIAGLQTMATLFPLIFMSVAAFLLNMVMNRLLNTQREVIGTLKAFGYRNTDITRHYVSMVLVIVITGAIVGIAAGAWLGHGMSLIFMEFYRFPYLEYILQPRVAIVATGVAATAAIAGTMQAVRHAARLPPAEAMRPEPPVRYRRTVLETLGLGALFDQPTRMIVRQINRHPVKSLLTLTGIAMAVAILMVGNFQEDAIDYMIDIQFNQSAREDVMVTFVEPAGRSAFFEVQNIPGVEYAEPYRSVPVRLSFRQRSYRTSIQGLEADTELHRLLDTSLTPVTLPDDGIVLTNYLAEHILGVQPGEQITVEVLEGKRPSGLLTVAGTVKEYMGASAYMDIKRLNRFMREGDAISGAFLATSDHEAHKAYARLKNMPKVAGVNILESSIVSFYENMADTILIFSFVNTLLAATIAVGVVYNSARIAFSERGRELASLRVLGFSRAEISYILLGELAVLTLAAIAPGFLIGRELCRVIATSIGSEIYRVPLVLETTTYALAATVVVIASVLSGLMIKHKLDRLDLVSVLKTRE